MKFIFATIVAIIFTASAYPAQAQQLPDLPGEKELRVKEDYVKYESLVKDVADWLEETDLDKQTDIRREAGGFIFDWVNGSPMVKIEISEDFFKMMEKNPHLTIIYMARYASYCIANNSYKDNVAPAKAGLMALVNVYKKGIGITKNKALEKLVSAADHNQLDDYIQKHMRIGPY